MYYYSSISEVFPAPSRFARASLNKLGRRGVHSTTGFWPHALLEWTVHSAFAVHVGIVLVAYLVCTRR